MRNLTSGNKMNFTIFALIVLIILIILCTAVIMVVRTDKEEYPVSNTMSIYDKDYNYIELENDAKIFKKWTGNYYLKEDTTKKEYNLGGYAIAFDKNKKTLDLYGNFYQVLKGGDISKISGYNTVSGNVQSQFYKIDDRKYLIAARNITNDTGSLSTQSYLIIIIDKLGNALLLNNKINAKTINEMIISTDDFKFDVANEILTYNDENINLKKIIGSTNEYVEKEEEKDMDWQNLIPEYNGGTSENGSDNSGNGQNADGSVINNQGGAQSGTNAGTSGNAGNGGDTIINNSNSSTNQTPLSKSVSLRGAIATSSYIDIEYAVQDPQNRYQTVYAFVEAVGYENTIALDKNATTYRLTDLEPNTEYKITLGYKEITEDNEVVDNIEDVLSVRTTKINASIDITRVGTGSKKVYFNLKLDQNYAFDYAKIALYVDGVKESDMDVNLTQAVKTDGWSNVLTYENYGSEITVQLEGTSHDGSVVNTNIQAKYRNY